MREGRCWGRWGQNYRAQDHRRHRIVNRHCVAELEDLPGAVTGWGRWARQINANGDIVGSLRTTDGSGSHAVVWKNQNLDPATGLPDPHAPLYGTPVDSVGGSGFFINNAGAVAGFSAEFYGFFWSMPGTTLPEGMVPPGSSYNLVSLHGLNENGQIVGESNFTANGPKTAYVWSGGVMRSLGTLGGVQSFGNALNNAGVVVGDFQLSSLDYHAFRWNSVNGMQDLNSTTLTPTKGAFTVFSGAAGIGSRGNIVGDGLVKRVDHAFLLTPKP